MKALLNMLLNYGTVASLGSACCAGVLPYLSSMAMKSVATADPSENDVSTRLVSML